MKARNHDLSEKRAVVQGIRTTYKIIGEGQPVLVLHGWGGSSDTWKTFLDQHDPKSGYSFISLDMPGFGKTDDPPTSWAVSDYVQFVLDFMRMQSLKNVVLVGHSFGGRVSIKLAAQFPKAVDAIVLVAAAGIRHPKTFKQKVSFILAKQGKKVMNLSFLRPFQSIMKKVLYKAIREKDYTQTRGVMRETFKKVISEDLAPYLDKITLPTLIVWGTKDSYVPVTDAYIMKEHIQGSIMEIIHGARHGIHKEMPGRLYKLITHFIAR